MKKVARKNSRFGLGWMPDLLDNRDHLYSAPLAKLRVLPTKAICAGSARKFLIRDKSVPALPTQSPQPLSLIEKSKSSVTSSHRDSSFIITRETLNTACRWITARKFATESRVWPSKAPVLKPSGLTTILLPIRPQISGLPEPSRGKSHRRLATKMLRNSAL
jgi:hypothetical protein